MKHGRLIAIILMAWALAYGKGNCAKGEPAPAENDKPSQKTRLKGKAQASSNLVRIYPEALRDMGGQTEVPEVFAMMTGKTDNRFIPYLKAANIQGIRNIVNWIPQPGQYGYKNASWYDHTPRFDTKAASLAWFDDFIQKDPYPLWEDLLDGNAITSYFDDRYGDVSVSITSHPRLFDPRMERNLPAARKHVDAYITALKSFVPQGAETRLTYYQLTNEPDLTRSWSAMFDHDQQLAVESYTRVFNALYDSVKAKHPDVVMPGTCIGHNGAFRIIPKSGSNPEKWDTWVKYFVDHVRNPDALTFYNAHAYGIPTLRNLAYVSMAQNYAENQRGVRPRFVITETSSAAGESRKEIYRNLFTYHGNDIFMMLNHPDKYAFRCAYVASPGGKNSLFNEIEGEGFVPEAPYWMFLTYQNLRGRNIHYESKHDDVRVFASAPEKDLLVIGLFNPTSGTQTVNLEPGIDNGQVASITRRKAVFDPSISNATYSEDELEITFPHVKDLEPKSAYAFEIRLNGDMEQTHTVKKREFYGSAVRAKMDDTIRSTIPIPYIPNKNGNARLSIAVNKKPASGSYRFELNGKEYTINWDDTPDKTANCWNTMVGYIEIPLGKGDIKKNNTLVLSPLTDNHLLFTSIVYHLYSFEK